MEFRQQWAAQLTISSAFLTDALFSVLADASYANMYGKVGRSSFSAVAGGSSRGQGQAGEDGGVMDQNDLAIMLCVLMAGDAESKIRASFDALADHKSYDLTGQEAYQILYSLAASLNCMGLTSPCDVDERVSVSHLSRVALLPARMYV